MSAPHACSIVSNNYLPYARTLCRSFREQHPDGVFHLLVVDEPAAEIDYEAEPFAVTFASELPIPGFANMAFRYSILELNTAVKPYFLRWLHDTTGCSTLCYFDPDILIVGSLAELYQGLDSVDVALTPHVLEPIDDDKLPSERDFLQSGIYNLGFLGIAFNDDTRRFLGWWQRRLHQFCKHDVANGLFVDQRWMDFAPAMLPRVEVLRDPGYNVAYWNLPHRRLSGGNGSWAVGDVPLRFFHFSGFGPDYPEAVSKFQNRYTLATRPDLVELFELYWSRLMEEGYNELEGLPYAYSRFSNGVDVPPASRELLQRTDPVGERWNDPFEADAAGSFLWWLGQPVDDDLELPLPRLALAIWDSRADLQQAFPEPLGEHLESFAHWLVHSGISEASAPASMIEDLRAAIGERGATAEASPPPAVTVASGGELETVGRKGSGDAWRLALVRGLDSRRAQEAFDRLSDGRRRWLLQDGALDGFAPPLVPRLAMLIHRLRRDLQQQFPEPLGRGRRGFADWYVTYGRWEYSLPAGMVEPVIATMPMARRVRARMWWLRAKMERPRPDAIEPDPGDVGGADIDGS